MVRSAIFFVFCKHWDHGRPSTAAKKQMTIFHDSIMAIVIRKYLPTMEERFKVHDAFFRIAPAWLYRLFEFIKLDPFVILRCKS